MTSILRAIAGMLFAFSLATISMSQEEGLGVLVHKERALDGYTLIAPQFDNNVYLIDNDGRLVNKWDIGSFTREAHLLENGNIVVVKAPEDEIDKSLFELGYSPDGAVAEYTWDGDLVWEYAFLGANRHQHHGIDVLPNGNVLAIIWDYHPLEEALVMGLDPAIAEEIFLDVKTFLPDVIVEIDRLNGEIVWTWNAWDHLIQNVDENLPNFGAPSANPQRIDINYQKYALKELSTDWSAGPADWMHVNSVNYNPALNQLVLSVHRFDEIWIINRNLTAEEAAGPAGDLLYRWGNPFAYGQGSLTEDRKLFQQHDAQWIDEGSPGAGNLLIYNNRNNVVREDEQAEDEYSSIIELKLPLRDDGSYDWDAEAEIVWQYDKGFYSRIISGVQRLPNGNTLITEGVPGRLLEVTHDGEVVWEFISPVPEDRNWLFRVRKYPADHPGFAGKDLLPGPVLGA